MKIAVAQLGSRMHYAVPKIFYQNEMLSHFYTDICADKPPFSILKSISFFKKTNAIKRFLTRTPNIPSECITHYPILGLNYYLKKTKNTNIEKEYQTYINVGKSFNAKVNKDKWYVGSDAVYLFNTAAFDICKIAQSFNKKVFLEQCIIPAELNFEILDKEIEIFPDWVKDPSFRYTESKILKEYSFIEKEEWQLADKIIVPSDFVKTSLENLGVSKSKLTCVPYGVSINEKKRTTNYEKKSKLNVLCVGYLELRKGVQYFTKVAERYNFANFRYVGSVQNLSEFALKIISNKVELTGHVSKSEIQSHFEWADVFLFLSLGEGSATVIYEALSFGLPVITTYQAGSIIEHEKSGYIVDPKNTDQVIYYLDKILNSKEFNQINNGFEVKKKEASYEAYEERLVDAIRISS